MGKKTKQTIAYYAAFFFLGSVLAALGPTIDGLSLNIGRQATQVSYFFSLRAVGYLTGALLGGFLYERIPGHFVLAGMIILLGGILFLTPATRTLPFLIPLLIGTGVSCGAMDVGSNTFLAKTHKDQSTPYLNGMYLLAGIGSFLAPLYLGSKTLTGGYQGLAFLSLPIAGWLLFTSSPTLTKNDKNHPDAASDLDILVLFAFLSFLYIGLEVSYSGWIFTYLQQQFPDNLQTGYYLTSVFWAAITAGRLIAIPASTRFKSSQIILSLLGFGIISVLVLTLISQQIWSLWVGTAGVGFSLAALFPTTFSYVQQKAPLTPRENGFVWAIGSMGSVTLPWLIGWQIGRNGPQAMMLIQLGTWIAAFSLFLGLLHKNQQRAKSP